MKTGWKLLLVTFGVGIPAFILGPVIWPPVPEIRPTPAQLPYLIGLSGFEALVSAFGVGFLIFGWPLVRRIARSSRVLALSMYLATSWMLVTWWPHDNMHIHNGLDLDGLIVIDYLFHVTLMIASLVIAYGFFRLMREKAGTSVAEETCAEACIAR